MQPKVHAENFIRGAFLITLAQLVTKVLGAVHRPIAQIFIGDAGLAMATPPSTAYYILMAMSAYGLNVAISRLVSERLAMNDFRGARRVFRVSVGTLLISGVTFSLLLVAISGWLADAQGFPESRPGFLVLAPAIFLAAVVVAYRGLYQGMQQMQPSALSQVVEQTGRVVISLALIPLFTPLGLEYGAAAFNAGNAIGILLSVGYLAWFTARHKVTADWTAAAPAVDSYEHTPVGTVVQRILAIAVPLALIGAVPAMMNAVDAALVTTRLLTIGVEAPVAKEALAWLGNAGSIRDVASILTTALYISLVPAITQSFATGQLEQARYRAATAFRLTFLLGIPATAGLLFGARDVYSVLFKGQGYIVLAPMALSTIFLMLQQTSSGILQGMGRVWLTVGNLLTGIGVKAVLTYWWTGLPSLGPVGAAYASTVGFGIAAVLNLLSLRRLLGDPVDWRGDVLRPTLAAGVMSLVLVAVSPLAHSLIPLTRIAGLATVLAGGLAYLVAIFWLGGVTEADLGLIPGVTARTVAWLRRVRLLRS